MKRIGIDGHMLGNHSGGNESYYSNILQNMNLTDLNIEVFLFLNKDTNASRYEKKFNIVRFKSDNAFVRNFIELPFLCKKYKLDLIHVQYFIPFYRFCPVVCTIHDICFEYYSDIFSKKEYVRQKLLIPYAAKKSAAIFTVSEHSKNDIAERYSIDRKNIFITYNAVSNKFYKMTKEELNDEDLRSRFKIGKERFLLYVGNLQPRKNLHRLVNAFIKYINLTKDTAKLVIVGKISMENNDLISDIMLYHDNIILTDYVNDEDLVCLYNSAHGFIYPSYYEGFGIPPLEALACGTPVAVSNAAAIPEIVGNAGIYFDPFNVEEIVSAIDTIMNDDNTRNKIMSNSIKRVSHFSWKESADMIVNVYKQLIN